MSKPSIECQYFEHVPEHSVAACRECRYAVWPDQIEGHLQKQHKVSYKEAEAVGQQVRSWAGLVQYPSELEQEVRRLYEIGVRTIKDGQQEEARAAKSNQAEERAGTYG
ncbi:hypothetical protein A1F94_013651 [Pyrenophora tritici-repentis]|nr:hypothetical protein A1F94_013651 [Pyrenophora tritici-repentis]